MEPPQVCANSKNKVLFLCTGNYYRSRYAEALFNHLATGAGLNWEATSRGLAIERLRENIGPIAQATVAALDADDISLVGTGRMPRRCTIDDLMAAEIIIAVKEAEHRELLAERFSGWENRTVYWHVHDIDEGHPDAALAQLKRHVKGLARRLAIPNG